MTHRSPIRIAAFAAALTLALGACGDDPDAESGSESTAATTAAPTPDTTAAEPAFPVDVEYGGTTVTIDVEPESIVSLSPTATEMLFAIEADDQVVAVDQFSYYPPEAPITDLDGNASSAEAVLAYEPDLVVIQYDPGDLVAGLEAAGVPTLVLPSATTLDDAYAQIDALGTATGHADDAAALVDQMETDIAEIVAAVPERAEPLTYYHELDDTLYSVTSATFIGELYGLLGFENVADAADADGAAGGYPQLSAEYLVDADPDVIFLADTKCCSQTAETVAARAGWDQLGAVTAGNIVELDDDIASRWGPRVVDFLRAVADGTAEI